MVDGDDRLIDTDKYEGHTEGKWTLEKVEQTDAEHEHYLLIGNSLLLSAIHHGGQEWDEHEANAQLIADAPLLLAEVKRLREGIQNALYLFQEAGNPKMSDKKRLDTICDALLEVIE